jgi:hypothetical protein
MTPSLATTQVAAMSGTAIQLGAYDVAVTTFILISSYKLVRYLLRRQTSRLVALKGPPNTNILFGLSAEILKSFDRSAIYQQWANEYGAIYTVPTALGGSRVIICDPKAAAHIYAKDTYAYVGVPVLKRFMKKFVSHPHPDVNYTHYHDASSDRICCWLKEMIIGGELQLCSVREDCSVKLKPVNDGLCHLHSATQP